MSDLAHQLGVYLHLARASQRRRRFHARDRLLVLAAATAAEAGLPGVAGYCRHLILRHNPGHMLRRWPTLAAALQTADFQHFLRNLRRRYPLEKAERMLSTLGIQMARERETYYSDLEYAAAVLGVTPARLEQFAQDSESR